MVFLTKQEPGFVVSGLAHAAILLVGFVAFSATQPFADHEEAVAVEVISESDLRAITRGERTAKEVTPTPRPRADKVAEVAEEKPDPGEARREIAARPSRPPDVPPAEKVAVVPPPPVRPEPAKPPEPRPEPVKAEPRPEPVRVEPKLEPVKPDAELRPEPPRPEPPRPEPPKPEPPKRPEPVKVVEQPKPPEKKPDPKPEPRKQDIARLLEQARTEEKPAAKPAEPEARFNPGELRKLLESKEKPQNAAATGREVNRTASLGTATGNASKLSLSQRDALGALLKEQLAGCWSPPIGLANATSLKPQVRMKLNPDGSLSAEPVLANAAPDPAFRSLAESALRAVRRCAPFRIPAQYAPFYADWRDWNIVFDPKDFLG